MKTILESKPWGSFEGHPVRLWRLVNANGVELQFTDFGGRLVKAFVPDRDGTFANVTLGWETLDEYVAEHGGTYFGALVGRYGNRIGNGRFSLEGKEYTLECTNAPGGIPCALHGGTRGFSLRCWDVVEEIHTDDRVGLVMQITSPDGEGGYPGNVTARVTLTLNNENVWRLDYEATTDQATPLAFTEHAYWNLDGTDAGTTILDHDMQISADRFTPYNAGMIPTGELRDVAGTPFDFRTPHTIGERHDADDDQLKFGAGYDINWVVNDWDGVTLRPACRLSSARTGRLVEIWTTEPGMQVYDGYYLPVRNAGVALETQHFPDSPNKPEFPSVIVRPGETLRSTTEYRFKTI
jgi:aldose 1-epimerase